MKQCSFKLALLSLFFILLFFNACKEDPYPLITSESGYQYRHYIQNNGPKPQVGQVAYYYFISHADDSLMMNGKDANLISKLEIPNIPPSRKIRNPNMEMIKLMSIGDSLKLTVPFDSLPEMPAALGKPKNLYYDLVLIDIKSRVEHDSLFKIEKNRNLAYQKEITEFMETLSQEYSAGLLEGQLIQKPSGLKYIIHEEGQGSVPAEGDIVQLRYFAKLANGDMFDTNLDKTHTLPVKVGATEIRVVEGWKEALFYLKRGTKATLFIPYQLGYGENGAPGFIPPKAELAYYIEVVK